MTLLQALDLAVGYRRFRQADAVIASGISVSLKAGDLICLLGPNGAGKTTLIRTLSGMQKPLAGRVLLDGKDIGSLTPQARARHLSLVLTDRIEVGMLSVYALVALGRHPYTDWQGRLTPQDEQMIRWAIQVVGAESLVSRNVSELSDGERQKVMIARALAQEPDVMVLDEPTAFLDLPHRVEVMQILRRLTRETGRAVLLSTHDLDLALRHADTIWLMPMNGQLVTGAPEDLVLSGAFETAFHSDGVIFDRQSGSFKAPPQPIGKLVIVGNGTTAIWTERALQRAGYEVLQGNNSSIDGHITIITEHEQTRWRLIRGEETQECESIEALVAALRKID
jgi:iron complex transport system ATP-binding protein